MATEAAGARRWTKLGVWVGIAVLLITAPRLAFAVVTNGYSFRSTDNCAADSALVEDLDPSLSTSSARNGSASVTWISARRFGGYDGAW